MVLVRIPIAGRDYYRELSMPYAFGLPTVPAFREKFPNLQHVLVSKAKREELVELGLVPKSFDGNLVLCEEIDPLLEVHGRTEHRSRGRPRGSYKTEIILLPPNNVPSADDIPIVRVVSRTQNGRNGVAVESQELKSPDSLAQETWRPPLSQSTNQSNIMSVSPTTEPFVNFTDRDGNLLTCKLCLNEHKNFRFFREHRVEYKHFYTMYLCEHCPYIAPCDNYLDRHIMQAHPEQAAKRRSNTQRFHCQAEHCNSVFRSGSQYYDHVLEHHPNESFVCSRCFATFKLRAGYASHCKTPCYSSRAAPPVPVRRATLPEVRREAQALVAALNYEIDFSKCLLCPEPVEFSCPIVSLYHKQTHHPEHVTDNDAMICMAGKWEPRTLELRGRTHFICKICHRLFSNRYRVRYHELAHIGYKEENLYQEKSYICGICNLELPDAACRREHIFETHPCPECDKHFEYERLFFRHQGFHKKIRQKSLTHKQPRPRPLILRKSRVAKTSLTVSKLLAKKRQRRLLECTKCGGLFNDSRALRHHQTKPCDPSNLRFKCEFCGRAFSIAMALGNHMSAKHPEEWKGAKGPFECQLCSKVLYNRKVFQAHVNKHTGVRYECTNCGKYFFYASMLRDHCQKPCSAEMYKFKCEVCQNVYQTENALKAHMFAHISGLKKQSEGKQARTEYKCELCSKVLVNRPAYNLHIAIHRNDRRYKCDRCSKSFYRRQDLRRHSMDPCDPNDYKTICVICRDIFKTQKQLNDHMRRIHPPDNNNSNHVPIAQNEVEIA